MGLCSVVGLHWHLTYISLSFGLIKFSAFLNGKGASASDLGQAPESALGSGLNFSHPSQNLVNAGPLYYLSTIYLLDFGPNI